MGFFAFNKFFYILPQKPKPLYLKEQIDLKLEKNLSAKMAYLSFSNSRVSLLNSLAVDPISVY
jgi:hypothetical protein